MVSNPMSSVGPPGSVCVSPRFSEQCSEMSLSESRTWSPFIEQSMEWFTLEMVSLVQGSSSNSSSSSPDEPSAAEHEGKL